MTDIFIGLFVYVTQRYEPRWLFAVITFGDI